MFPRFCRFRPGWLDYSVNQERSRRGEAMKYLCLVYQVESDIEAMPQREYERIVDEVLFYREELRESGNYITSSPLQPVREAMTIRVRNGKVSVTDGPFAETREQLGGFYLI